jgi:hypothetical protein
MMIDDIKSLRAHLLIGLTLVVPSIAAAGPNQRSVADIQACQPAGTQAAQVCSTKELSNVVVQCAAAEGGSFFVKFDDLHAVQTPYQDVAFSLTSPYQGDFNCPEGSTLVAVFVKSGSEKYSGPAMGNLPRGAGAIIMNLGACSAACSSEGGETPPEETPPEETPPEETPPEETPPEEFPGN